MQSHSFLIFTINEGGLYLLLYFSQERADATEARHNDLLDVALTLCHKGTMEKNCGIRLLGGFECLSLNQKKSLVTDAPEVHLVLYNLACSIASYIIDMYK